MEVLLKTVVDVNSTTLALTGNENTFIKFHSDAEATMSGDGVVLSLDFSNIENGGVRKFGLSNVFNNIERNVFTFHGVDADDATHTETVEVDMIDYIKLTCNFESASMDGSGGLIVSCLGNFFNGSFGDVTNTITAKMRFAEFGTDNYCAWQRMTVSKSGNTYYAYYTLANLDYTKNYTFEVKVNDKLEEKTAIRTFSSKPIFHWGKDDVAFEVPVEMRSKLQVYGDLVLRYGELAHGNKLVFGDEGYCYIAEARDDFLTIYADKGINLETGSQGEVSINGDAVSGTWEPALLDEAISSYTACHGWYTKLGDIVTVGFYIKAVSNEGYEDENIEIKGLPFPPSKSAAGGGMCSGAYVTGGYNFQCFVAEKDSTITTRVQICNHTASSALSTSGSGCKYCKLAGIITLSGTITYMTE